MVSILVKLKGSGTVSTLYFKGKMALGLPKHPKHGQVPQLSTDSQPDTLSFIQELHFLAR